jgi:ligand-binding SRPBCC domain-containing protein
LKFENTVNYPFSKVIKNIGKEMFVALNPPWSSMELLRFDGTKVSDEVHLNLNFGFKKLPWVSKIVKSDLSDVEFNFIDIGFKMLPGMKSWHHQHIFRSAGNNQTIIIDDVSFEASNSAVELIYSKLIYIQLYYRKFAYENFLSKC